MNADERTKIESRLELAIKEREAHWFGGWPDGYADDVRALLGELDKARAAMKDALEGLEEMLPYIDGYFVEKWKLGGYVDRARGFFLAGSVQEETR